MFLRSDFLRPWNFFHVSARGFQKCVKPVAAAAGIDGLASFIWRDRKSNKAPQATLYAVDDTDRARWTNRDAGADFEVRGHADRGAG